MGLIGHLFVFLRVGQEVFYAYALPVTVTPTLNGPLFQCLAHLLGCSSAHFKFRYTIQLVIQFIKTARLLRSKIRNWFIFLFFLRFI